MVEPTVVDYLHGVDAVHALGERPGRGTVPGAEVEHVARSIDDESFQDVEDRWRVRRAVRLGRGHPGVPE